MSPRMSITAIDQLVRARAGPPGRATTPRSSVVLPDPVSPNAIRCWSRDAQFQERRLHRCPGAARTAAGPARPKRVGQRVGREVRRQQPDRRGGRAVPAGRGSARPAPRAPRRSPSSSASSSTGSATWANRLVVGQQPGRAASAGWSRPACGRSPSRPDRSAAARPGCRSAAGGPSAARSSGSCASTTWMPKLPPRCSRSTKRSSSSSKSVRSCAVAVDEQHHVGADQLGDPAGGVRGPQHGQRVDAVVGETPARGRPACRAAPRAAGAAGRGCARVATPPTCGKPVDPGQPAAGQVHPVDGSPPAGCGSGRSRPPASAGRWSGRTAGAPITATWPPAAAEVEPPRALPLLGRVVEQAHRHLQPASTRRHRASVGTSRQRAGDRASARAAAAAARPGATCAVRGGAAGRRTPRPGRPDQRRVSSQRRRRASRRLRRAARCRSAAAAARPAGRPIGRRRRPRRGTGPET